LVSYYGYGDIVGDWYSKPDPFYCRQDAVPKKEAYAAIGSKPLAEDKGGNDRGRFYLYCRQNGLWPKEVSGYDPDSEPERFVPFCPIQNVDKDFTPTFLLHGDADTDVPHHQSVMMANELERMGVEHEFISIPGGPHGFDHQDGGLKNPRNREAFDRVLAFLGKHVKR
jgi:dipeptidyl aminopeptidase/acylaminoacyl peptidase